MPLRALAYAPIRATLIGLTLVTFLAGCDLLRSPHERGARYLRLGDYQRAASAYDEAVAESLAGGDDESLAIAYANRCYARGALGQHADAITDCTESLRLKAGAPEALNNRGVAYLSLNRLDEAESDFSAALEVRPEYADAYANRGRVYIDREEYDLALEDLDRAIELDGTLLQAFANRAFVRDTLGDVDAALTDYSSALELAEDPQVYFSRGMLHYRFGRFDDAYLDFRAAESAGPDTYVGYMARAQADSLENRPTSTPAPEGDDDEAPAEDEPPADDVAREEGESGTTEATATPSS